MPGVDARTTCARAVGTPASAMTSLAKALLPSSRAAAAPGRSARMPGGAQRVAEPGHQRRLGPDHHQVDPEGAAARATTPPVSSSSSGDHLGVARRCPRCRRRRGSGALGGAGDRPHEGVLAPSASHDQHRAAHPGTLAHAAVGGAAGDRPATMPRDGADPDQPLSRAEREAHRAMLEEALAELPRRTIRSGPAERGDAGARLLHRGHRSGHRAQPARAAGHRLRPGAEHDEMRWVKWFVIGGAVLATAVVAIDPVRGVARGPRDHRDLGARALSPSSPPEGPGEIFPEVDPTFRGRGRSVVVMIDWFPRTARMQSDEASESSAAGAGCSRCAAWRARWTPAIRPPQATRSAWRALRAPGDGARMEPPPRREAARGREHPRRGQGVRARGGPPAAPPPHPRGVRGRQGARRARLPDRRARWSRRPSCSWVRSHHERWDGRGYPDGLADHEIPHGAAILGVADAWDAMIHRSFTGTALTEDRGARGVPPGVGSPVLAGGGGRPGAGGRGGPAGAAAPGRPAAAGARGLSPPPGLGPGRNQPSVRTWTFGESSCGRPNLRKFPEVPGAAGCGSW